jgi:hypothetical protein
MAKENNLDEVFVALKKILAPSAKRMEVAEDTDTAYMLNTHHMMPNKQPLYFGGVRRGKSYVSFHLFPVYASSDLMKGVSPELRKRMQGKSCFNFKTVDQPLFRELSELTRAGAKKFSDDSFVAKLQQAWESASQQRKAALPKKPGRASEQTRRAAKQRS